jgi:hypothetical protein
MELYLLRLGLSPFLYALKLKVEFMVLNRLTSMGKRRIELRHITVLTTGEEDSAAVAETTSPFDINPTSISRMGQMDLESGTIEHNCTVVGKNIFPDETRKSRHRHWDLVVEIRSIALVILTDSILVVSLVAAARTSSTPKRLRFQQMIGLRASGKHMVKVSKSF